jgi:sugar lactone lactonase YvrE
MTLASWYSSMRNTQSRLIRTGARRKRPRAFHRMATFDALEDRCLLSTVSFKKFGETVNESAGGFSIPVTLSSPPSGTPTVTRFAGGFKSPNSVAVGGGAVYVANDGDDTVSKVSADGNVTNFAFGTGLNSPQGLAIDDAGNLYLSDPAAGTVDEVPAGGGAAKTFATGFSYPAGLAFDASGNLYVANSFSDTVDEVPRGGGAAKTFATGLSGPTGLAFDDAGNLYVTNFQSDTLSIVPPTGGVAKTFATGLFDALALAIDSAGTLYVACSLNPTIYQVSREGAVSNFASGLNDPTGLAFDSAGTLYVANNGDGTVSQVTQTVAVPFTVGGSAISGVDYVGLTAAPLTFGIGQTTLDINGTLLTDPGPTQTMTFTLATPIGGAVVGLPSVNTLTVTEPAGVQFGAGSETVNESAGMFSIPVTVSGIPSTNVSPFASGFNSPLGVASDAAGNFYVANLEGGTVSKVPAAGGEATTFATGLNDAFALAFDSAGNLYVTDPEDGTVNIVTSSGQASNFASGLDNPRGLAFDAAGNLFVANAGNGTVSELSPTGVPITFITGFDGPGGLAFDAAGDLYVANAGNGTVSEVPAGKRVPQPFVSGFNNPLGLAFDSAGNLYVANYGDNTVDDVSPAGVISLFASGFGLPAGLALVAGRMVVTNLRNNTMSQVTTVAVPFALGGTAPAGVAYSGLTGGVLTFGIGQTTEDITGKLLSDPGPNQTLTVTLGAPTGGADLGSLSVNTLTITEPALVQFGTGSETLNESSGTFSIPVTVAGTLSSTAFAAGSGFNTPGSLAADAAGNIYVANAGDGTVSEVSPAGKVSLFASGFKLPLGLDFHAGNLYVADTGADTVFKVPAGGGKPVTFASGFNDPTGLAFDPAGNLYVANNETSTVSEVPAGGGKSTTFATGLNGPIGLAFGPDGNLYVANLDDGTVSKVSTSGGTPSTFASGFNNPIGLAFDSAGNLYVADSENNTVDEVTPTGVVTILASGFNGPAGLALVAGRMYVTDAGNNTMSQVTGLAMPFALGGSAASGVAYSAVTASPLTFGIGQTTLDITGTLLSDPGPDQTLTFTLGPAEGGAVLGSLSVNTLTIDEPAKVQFRTGSETVNESAGTFSIPVTLVSQSPTVSTFASGLDEPIGVAVDSAGNVYVTNPLGGTVSKVTPAGHVSTFESGFDFPTGLAVDSAGNLYVANYNSDTVSEVTPAGNVSTFAKGLSDPFSLAFHAGNLYVANDGDNTVSEVAPGGVVTTFATGFAAPSGLAFDSKGNLYVANNGSGTVSEVPAGGGTSTTFATGVIGPIGLAFDSAGNLYVADHDAVSAVTPANVVSTFAPGLNDPCGMAFAAGSLYVANIANNTVSQIAVGYSVPFTLGGTGLAAVDSVTASPLKFGLGQTTEDITGTLLSDPGPSQTLTFALGAPTGGAVLGSPSKNTLTLIEPPTVQFKAGSETVNEAAGTFSIQVTLSGAADSTVTVPFTLAGTAESGVAYSGLTASPLTFPIGQTTEDITGKLLSDPGPSQTMTFTLGAPTGGADPGRPSKNTLTLVEPPTVKFKAGSETVNEAAGTFSIQVTLSEAAASSVTVPFTLSGTAASGVAYSGLTVSPLTFPIGQTTEDITGKLLSDPGPSQTMTFTLGAQTGGAAPGSPSVNTLTITEPPTVRFSAGSETVNESAGTFSIPITLSAGAASSVTVPFILSGTAAAGVAYSGLTASPLTFPIGQTTEDITGKLLSDPGPSQTLTFTLGTPKGGAVVGSPSANTLTINELPTVQFSTGSETLSESTGTFSIPVTLSGAASAPVIVPYTLGGTAASGIAFSGVTAGVLTFGIGQTTEVITGTLLADPGSSQKLTFTLGTPTGGAILGSPSVNTLTINEPPKGPAPPNTGTTTTAPLPPVFMGEERVFSGKGKHKKLVGFEFLFNGALSASGARSTGNYHVTQKQGKKLKALRVKSALYNPINFSVTISVAGFNTGKVTQATIAGLEAADGVAIPQFESRL